MHIDVTFPGGLAVEARYRGFTIATDQPTHAGGGGSAPSPFDLFLASIATCAGLFALLFCRQRNLDTTGLAVKLEAAREQPKNMVTRLRLELVLPQGFPERYRDAIVRAVDQCTVKRHILQPPAFEVTVTDLATAAP